MWQCVLAWPRSYHIKVTFPQQITRNTQKISKIQTSYIFSFTTLSRQPPSQNHQHNKNKLRQQKENPKQNNSKHYENIKELESPLRPPKPKPQNSIFQFLLFFHTFSPTKHISKSSPSPQQQIKLKQ